MRYRHYADEAQPSLSIRFDWDEPHKRWIMTTTRPRSGDRSRAQVEYYMISTTSPIDQAGELLISRAVIAEMTAWLV